MISVTNPAENQRVITFGDKEVTLNRDNIGLWTFRWDSGEPPVKLSGQFTNVSTAVEFLANYLASLPPTKKKVTPVKEL